mgnify:FL=1
MSDEALAALVEQVRAGREYAALAPDFVIGIAAVELAHRGPGKATTKAVRSRLHQMVGAYEAPPADAPARLAAASDEQLPALAAQLRGRHASTREREAAAADFWSAVLADLPQPVSITDLACGLQPLSLPLVDLPRDVLYRAFDVHLGILATAEAFLQRWGQTHEVGSWDLLAGPPPGGHDLVLLLKTLPCLEQGRRGAGRALLAALEAQTVIVTYPLRSLGGRQVGMADHYRQQLAASVDGMPWRVEPLDLRGELGFRLRRA